MVFFSYRTKHESPAGDQFWKFSRSAQFLVAWATSELQFRTLLQLHTLLFLRKNSLVIIISGKEIKENKEQVRKPANFQKCGWSHLSNYYTTNNLLVNEQSANLHSMNWQMSDLFGKFSHQFIFLIHHGDNMMAACCVNYRTRYKLQV